MSRLCGHRERTCYGLSTSGYEGLRVTAQFSSTGWLAGGNVAPSEGEFNAEILDCFPMWNLGRAEGRQWTESKDDRHLVSAVSIQEFHPSVQVMRYPLLPTNWKNWPLRLGRQPAR